VVGKLFPNASVSRIWVMLTGIVIYVLLRAIPVAGWIIAVGVTLLGMGAIFLAVRQWMQSRSAPLEEIVEG
jgi:cytochrome b561